MNKDETKRWIDTTDWLSELGRRAWHSTLEDIRNLPEVPVNSR